MNRFRSLFLAIQFLSYFILFPQSEFFQNSPLLLFSILFPDYRITDIPPLFICERIESFLRFYCLSEYFIVLLNFLKWTNFAFAVWPLYFFLRISWFNDLTLAPLDWRKRAVLCWSVLSSTQRFRSNFFSSGSILEDFFTKLFYLWMWKICFLEIAFIQSYMVRWLDLKVFIILNSEFAYPWMCQYLFESSHRT